MDALEARLNRLEAERDIAQLFATYAAALDAPDPDAASACFSPDGRLTVRPSSGTGREIDLHGPAAVKEFVGQLPGRPRAFSQHASMGHRVSIAEDGQSATSESTFVVLTRGADGEEGSGTPVVGTYGRYSDELVHIEGRWYLQSRQALVDGARGAVR
jgi:hypothetical protein